MRLPTFRFRTISITVVTAVVFTAVGAYWGTYCAEREGVKKEAEASVLRLALNLQAIKYVREQKTAEAIDILSAINETSLFYLMNNDEVAPTNPDFVKRKRKVLTALEKERADHPIIGDKKASYRSDPEWQQYQRDIEHFLEQNRQNE